MLVISRRIREKVIINDCIQIEILEIERGKIRLGIIADPSTPVVREEIYEESTGKVFVPYCKPIISE